MSHLRKIELSNVLQRMCNESIYPPSWEMLKARCQYDFSDLNWSDRGLEKYTKNCLELFYGSGRMILSCLEQICQCYISQDIISLILEMRGKDVVVIEHRKYPQIAIQLQKICRDAGFDVIVSNISAVNYNFTVGKALISEEKASGNEDVKIMTAANKPEGPFILSLKTKKKTTQSLIHLRVGYQLKDCVVKPIYIGLADEKYPVDVKRAWRTLIGKVPSNVQAVQDIFYRIEEELDNIYDGIGELQVRLCGPL